MTTRASGIKSTVLLVRSEPAAHTDVAVSLIKSGFNIHRSGEHRRGMEHT